MLAAGLSHEGLLPIECLAPALLWLTGRGRQRLVVWTFAWYGIVALIAARYVVHFVLDHSYQVGLLSAADLSFRGLCNDFAIHMKPLREYYKVPRRLWRVFWEAGTIAGVLFGVGSIVASTWGHASPGRRRSLLGAGVAFALVQLGLLPFAFMPHNYRTQFFAALGEAALFACIVGCIVAFLPRRLQAFTGVAIAGWMVATTTVGAWASQHAPNKKTLPVSRK